MMARQPRLVPDGRVSHARSRHHTRPAVLSDDAGRAAFLEALDQTTARHPFWLYGYGFPSRCFSIFRSCQTWYTPSNELRRDDRGVAHQPAQAPGSCKLSRFDCSAAKRGVISS